MTGPWEILDAVAVLLILGGDKSQDSKWNNWYRTAIPEAELIYERYRRGDTA